MPHLSPFEISREPEAGRQHSLQLFPGFIPRSLPLSDSVSTVNDDVSASTVGASIAGEIDVCTLQLSSLCVTTHRDHAVPELLSLLVDEVGETGVDVAWGDGVDAGEVPPFVGKGFREVDAGGFGDVVGGLQSCQSGRHEMK